MNYRWPDGAYEIEERDLRHPAPRRAASPMTPTGEISRQTRAACHCLSDVQVGLRLWCGLTASNYRPINNNHRSSP
ncbi:hypothetical protein FHW16_005812 [Phyllobacterium myrsinacearum]|uniref:Uncharacterized protein n=1 Tax=Phyllobacterium myrsinacearum TaxID=28101 RepID=A0A839EX15_9HYPH|nr:hypothetical protein [Phyllobacterium myrsinacearum]